tara:strand:- start:440 stop:1474 length:1035 start_codon:yes stop_codon:yes gene_type:complete
MNSIFVPKSIKHSNITDDEIKAFYSLRPVNASNDDYDFTKQLDKIITEYLEYQSFATPNARRCFKKQLKKMILVDKPKNSKKYDHFLSWRLKQISQIKSKQRDFIIDCIQDKDLSKRFNDLSAKYTQQTTDMYALIQENEELKQKIKSMSIIDPVKEKEIIQSNYTEEELEYESSDYGSSDEEELSSEEDDFESYEEEVRHTEVITNDCKNIILDILQDMKSPPVEKPVEPKKTIINDSEAKEKLIIKTKHISEEEYKALETDGKMSEAFWLKIDECIEEIEKFFIKSCDRDKDKITELSNIFYDWHADEYNNILEVISDDADTDKMCDKPFEVLRDNLNQEAK